MPIPFDQIPVGEGMLPDGSRVPFFIDRWAIESARERGFAERYDDARFVPLAIGEPDAIFRGLRRPNQNESFAYSIRPGYDPDDDEDQRQPGVLPRYGEVFLAFVEVRGMGMVVFDWTWRDEDPDVPGHPANREIDFAGKVWPHEPN